MTTINRASGPAGPSDSDTPDRTPMFDFRNCVIIENMGYILRELPDLDVPDNLRLLAKSLTNRIIDSVNYLGAAWQQRKSAKRQDTDMEIWADQSCLIALEVLRVQMFAVDVLLQPLFKLDDRESYSEINALVILLAESMGNALRSFEQVELIVKEEYTS